MNARPPYQPSLFGDEPQNAATVPIALPAVSNPHNPAQRSFNRLIERICRLRDALVAWDAYIARFRQRVVGELAPVESAITSAQRRLALRLDALLAATEKRERLGRAHRRKAHASFVHLAEQVLAAGPDPEIEAAYDRHGELSYAEQRRLDVEFGEAMASEIFGREAVQGHDATNMEDVLHHAAQRSTTARRERTRTRAEHGNGNAGNRRQQAAQARADATRETITLSVREVYRRLARALHPDRETDPQAREHKTLLMQRANQAYEHNDLLTLLTLQLETEQIDAAALAGLAAEQFARYNLVLKEQINALEMRIDECTAPLRAEFDLAMRTITPQLVEQALSARVALAHGVLKDIERETQRLADPRTRRAALDELPDPTDADDEFDAIAAMAQLMTEMHAQSTTPRVRPKSPPRGKSPRKKRSGGHRA